jgi:RNA polymerase sigma-70 factor (ECF subfamily)
MDDLSLALAAQKGDLGAFNQLVFTYQEMAFNLAYRILSDPDLAADATQNAFIAAYRNIKKYRGGSFKAWLLRIVTNDCYDELRRQKRRPTTSLEPIRDEDDEEVESPYWLADENPSPEEAIESLDLQQAIQHCIDNLPQDFRVVLVMVELEGLDYKEVAQAISKPLGTIKSRMARARMRVQDCLQKFRELLPEKYRLEDEEGT